ncbi:hypothetical protein GCM10007079_31180 [Nocardiopsis terrae]|nr:hypothetical protein GCM10007079_31180 [Nocardiopsis terrae]
MVADTAAAPRESASTHSTSQCSMERPGRRIGTEVVARVPSAGEGSDPRGFWWALSVTRRIYALAARGAAGAVTTRHRPGRPGAAD